MKKTLLLTIATLALIGCGGGGSTVDYLPFRATETDNWGMVAPNGEILFAGEFVNEPSVVIGGVFRVLNSDDKYELFKAGTKPEQIGTSAYIAVGMFTENVTPAVMENEPVTLIDKNGKVIAKIDKLNDKTVETVTSFCDGYAIYITAENKSGMIDTKGKVHIDASYDVLAPYKDGIALGLNQSDNGSNLYIIDKSGKGTLLKDSKDMVLKSYSQGIAIFKDGDNLIGFNDKAEKVLKFDSKIKTIRSFVGNYAFFNDGDAYGLIDKEGQIVIRAKYKSGNYIDKGVVTFLNNENKIVICDLDGTEKVATDFAVVLPFYNGKNAFALENNHWIVINNDGKEALPTTFYTIGGNGLNEDTEFKSDYINVNEVLATAMGTLTANGMSSYDLNTTAQKIVEKCMPKIDVNKLESGNDWTIYNDYLYISSPMRVSPKIKGQLNIHFDENPFSAITERVGYWYSYNKTVGYKINDAASVNRITINFTPSARHINKMENLTKAAIEYVKATGLFNEPKIEETQYIFQLKSDEKRQLSITSSQDNVSITLYEAAQ